MSFNNYYQDELIALRELGREFSGQNPGLAPFLGTPGRDPDVERILEGFAFLSGRLRQKLDDELPELTHALFNLLWPNYLRQIPSASILQFKPTDNLSNGLTVPRGTMVESIEVEGTHCRFQTAYATEVLPLDITHQHIIEKDRTAIIALDFGLVNTTLSNISVSNLRFYITGEKGLAATIYYTMLRKVHEIRIVAKNAKYEEVILGRLDPSHLTAVGFKEEEGLYPYPANTFPGYRILQEYFCFPEKFMFIDLDGIDDILTKDVLAQFQNLTAFSIHFVMETLPPQYESFRKENWQLFCTPIVNLFPMDATPLTLNHKQTEYRIVPNPRLPYHYSVYSVEKVTTWGSNGRGHSTFAPFESFEHDTTSNQPQAYYRLRLRPSIKDTSTETYISIVQPKTTNRISSEQVISLELICTNRLLPQALALGDINLPTSTTPSNITFKNITGVTPPYAPPLEGDILWRLLSNMSLNYLSLNSIPALRAVLTSYDFRALHDKQRSRLLARTLEGMVRIQCEETDRIYRGLPLRGARTSLILDEKCFTSEGDMFLFGSVLNEFFALYATVNSFHQLTVTEVKRGEQYEWPARLGSISHI